MRALTAGWVTSSMVKAVGNLFQTTQTHPRRKDLVVREGAGREILQTHLGLVFSHGINKLCSQAHLFILVIQETNQGAARFGAPWIVVRS